MTASRHDMHRQSTDRSISVCRGTSNIGDPDRTPGPGVVHTFHTPAEFGGRKSSITPLPDMETPPDHVAADQSEQSAGGLGMESMGVRASVRIELSTNRGARRRFPADRPHRPQEHELRHAYVTAKQLAEQLEVANLHELRLAVVQVRERLFLELLALNGVYEVVDLPRPSSTSP